MLRKLDALEKSNIAVKINFEKTLADRMDLEDLNEILDKELSEFKAEIETLESEKADLKNSNAKLKDENTLLWNKVDALEASLNTTEAAAAAELEVAKQKLSQLPKKRFCWKMKSNIYS